MTNEVIDRQTVEIVGDVSGLASAYAEAEQQAKGFETSLASIGKNLTSFGAKWSLTVSTPLALVAAKSVSTATTFDDSMRKVQAVTGATGEQFETLRQQALDLGSSTAYTASEAAEGMQYLGMAGLSTNEILEATPQMLSLASAGSMDLATAADIATNVLSGFNLQVSDLTHVSDVLASAAASSNTSVSDLGSAMAYVGPVAAAAGISIEETTAAIETLSNAGIQGERAGTSLRGAISALLSPSTEATKALANYGLTAADVDPQVHSLSEIIATLGGVGLSTADAMTIFGRETGPGMIALLTAGSDSLDEYTGALENCDGAAEKMADTIESGPGGKLREFQSKIESVSITLGDLITDALLPVIEKIGDLADWLTSLDEGTQNAIVYAGLFAVALGPATLALGAMASGVSNIIALYRTYQASTLAATIATKGLTAAIASNPIGLAIIGVTTLGAVLLSLSAATNDATDAQEDYNEAVGAGIDLTQKSNEELQTQIENLETSAQQHRDLAAALRGETTPATVDQADATTAAADATADLTDSTNDQIDSFRDALKASKQYSGALATMKQAEREAAAAAEDAKADTDAATAAEYKRTLKLRALASGAEEAYKRASSAVKTHQKKVSELQSEYDTLKQTIDDALSIDDDIEDAGRSVERADIRKQQAQVDLDDLNEQIAEKEREMQTTDYGSIDAREDAVKELAALKLRQRSAVLDLADAQDAYTDALQKQSDEQTKKTQIEKDLNGESIDSAQNRLDEIGQKIQDETDAYQNAINEREAAQQLHETFVNDLNNQSLTTQADNWATYVEWLNNNPAIARTFQLAYDANGNLISSPATVEAIDITAPEFQSLSTSGSAAAVSAATQAEYGDATVETTDTGAVLTPVSSSPAPATTATTTESGGNVIIENLNVTSTRDDAETVAKNIRKSLRTLGSRVIGA